jgi:hypothetical protein
MAPSLRNDAEPSNFVSSGKPNLDISFQGKKYFFDGLGFAGIF